MNLTIKMKKSALLGLPVLLLWSLSFPGWALIEATDAERETIVEMIDQLEQRHYAKHPYDDGMSSAHLDSYIESLDRERLRSGIAATSETSQAEL